VVLSYHLVRGRNDRYTLFKDVGGSTPFTALARRSAHLVQFGSFVYKQPKWRPYQQPPFFVVVTFVAITFISDPNYTE
jgi:hypothetical protein